VAGDHVRSEPLGRRRDLADSGDLRQANQLLTWLALVDRVAPDSVTRIRFAQLRFPGSAMLPDRYDAVSRRDPSGQFTLVTLRRQGGPGSMQLR